jgi:hypothetical protein
VAGPLAWYEAFPDTMTCPGTWSWSQNKGNITN